MFNFKSILMSLPEVKGPVQKKLSFREKLKWTLIILVAFFVLSATPLFGLGQNSLLQFEQLSIILGASFGSILTLGIGPIVTASIVLQLLNGSGLFKIDTKTQEGKAYFQGIQKTLAIFFIIFESFVFIFFGGLTPIETLPPTVYRTMQLLLVFQLFLGGALVLFMDEVISKWGFGSGISLFIAASVSSEIFIRAFSPLTSTGQLALSGIGDPVGAVWVFFRSVIQGNFDNMFFAFAAILATIVIFVFAVYAQAMKVEIPLSFGRIRGHGIRWPLNFIYTSNIPVILIAALVANIQVFARLLQSRAGSGITAFISQNILGQFSGSTPVSGLVFWLFQPNIVQEAYLGVKSGSFAFPILIQALVYALFFILGSIIFSVFWIQTSGMDAKTQADNILASGLQIPGFRRDPRVVEQILSRYIFPLTIMGGATVGLLAASADLLGALSRGTGILLTVMIVYRLYEEIAQQHLLDMHPALRRFWGG